MPNQRGAPPTGVGGPGPGSPYHEFSFKPLCRQGLVCLTLEDPDGLAYRGAREILVEWLAG